MKSNFINGEWVAGTSDFTFDVFNPATEEKIQTISEASSEDVNAAVEAAYRQMYEGDWGVMLPNRKEAVLLKYADSIEQNTEELSALLVAEHGKLLADAKKEVQATVNCFRYYAGWATKISGETLDVSLGGAKHFAYTQREPIGVVGAIAPWNVPMMMYAWKIAPALACGCGVVFKPSEETPLTAMRLAELSQEAGVPDGVINIINGRGSATGKYLLEHPKVSKISFTGSTEVGRIIGRESAYRLKEFTLELGGKNPVLVLDDANMDDMSKGAAKGIFYNQGQVCVSGSRIYLPKKSYDNLLGDIADMANSIKVGSGMDSNSQMGPLVSKTHQFRVMSYINAGIDSGIEIAAGGATVHDKGYYVVPTVFSNPDNRTIDVLKEEIFGPVIIAEPYEDIDDLVKKANDSAYGLAASIWTNDIRRMQQLVSKLHAGVIYVNSPVRSDPNLPLGGFKQSGIGKELGKASIDAFTRTKSVVVAH